MGKHRAKACLALFVDPQGPNWRNNVAHGALATDTSPGVPATLSLFESSRSARSSHEPRSGWCRLTNRRTADLSPRRLQPVPLRR